MKTICYSWLSGIVWVFLLAGTGTAGDILPGDKVSPVPGKVKTCGGTVAGSRWCDQGDGTVKDLTTGLIWLQKGDCWDRLRWYAILPIPFKRLRHGTCGLADNSQWGDWRPPTHKELAALAGGPDAIRYKSPGPFTGLQSGYYWTATTRADNRDHAWSVNMLSGAVISSPKHMMYYLWPVRNE